jgi:hypothetical protein
VEVKRGVSLVAQEPQASIASLLLAIIHAFPHIARFCSSAPPRCRGRGPVLVLLGRAECRVDLSLSANALARLLARVVDRFE